MPPGTSETITDSIITMIEVKAWEVNDKIAEERNGGEPIFRNSIRQIGTSQGLTGGPPGIVPAEGGGSASRAALTL